MTDRIWLKSYPQGVPADIDVAQFDSLATLIDDCFTQHAARVGYSFMGRDLSYRQVDSLSMAFGAYLQKLGLGKGDVFLARAVAEFGQITFGGLQQRFVEEIGGGGFFGDLD